MTGGPRAQSAEDPRAPPPRDPGRFSRRTPGARVHHLRAEGESVPMNSDPPPGGSGPARPLRRNLAIAGLVVAVMVVAALVTAARGAGPGRSATSRPVSLT